MLTEKMQRAACLLFKDDLTDEHIAEECGISRKTLGLWKKKPEFSEALEGMSAKQRERAYSSLECSAELAANTLIELVQNGNDQVRLKASLELLRITRADTAPASQKERSSDSQDIETFFGRLLEAAKQ